MIAHPGLWVALLTLALYLPSAGRIVQLSPDMVEHVDIARRLARGDGYQLGIKAYQLGGTDVVEDGLVHRPPLLTVALAGLFALGQDLHAAQALHSIVGALSAVLVYSTGRRIFGQPVGIAAGVLAAACPFAFKVQVPLMTEGLSTLLILAGVRLLVGAADRPAMLPFTLAGLAFGLGYLARPTVLVVSVASMLATMFVVRDRMALLRPLAGMLAGTALVVVPMSLFSLMTRGRVIYSGKTYLYAVVSDRAVIEEAFSQPLSTPGEFIWTHAGYILQTVVGLAYTYARWIVLDPEWLLPLLPGWPLAFILLTRGRYPRAIWIPLTAAAANYVFYSLTWATWQDRFMLPTLLLLLPLGIDGLFRTAGLILRYLATRLHAPGLSTFSPAAIQSILVAAIVLFWMPELVEQYRGSFTYFDRPSGTRTDGGIRWTGPPRWVNDDDFGDVAAWVSSHTAPDTIVAVGQPWPLSLFADRTSILIPLDLDEAELRQFIVVYRVSHFLMDGRDPRRRPYRHNLEDLADDGVRATKVGAVTVFDTRALWQ